MIRSMPALSIPALPILRAALLGATALALAASGPAFARVGVTSATDGEPHGKPPQEAERVLRIGIDVQADEVITTGANDRAHLVFLDGTSLTVGPGAQVTIDKFVYDPNTKTGELAVTASKGVLRLVGGKISKTNPITITTPSSTIGIRGGITLLDVQPRRTTSTFVFGDHMTVSGLGHTERVTRPGSQITATAGAPPPPPVLAPKGSLSAQLGQFDGNSGSNSQGGQSGGQGGGAGGGGNAEQRAQQFGQQNSGQGPQQGPQARFTGPINQGNAENRVINVVSAAGQQNLPGKASGSTTTAKDTIVTQVIVTRGRFLAEPSSGSVIPSGSNNLLLQTSSTLTTTNNTSSTLKITTSDGRSITLPWKQDTAASGFTIDAFTDPAFGRISGTGYVSADKDFFAYVFTDANNRKLGFFGGTPTSTVPTTGFAAYTVNNLGSSGRLPFANGTVGDDTNLKASADISKMLTAYSQSLAVGQPVTDNRSVAMQSTISISGTGTTQKSYTGVLIGFFVPDGNSNTGFAGNFSGTYRLGGTNNVGRLSSTQSTPSVGTGDAIYGTNANNIALTPDQISTTYSTTTSGGNTVVDSFTTTRTPASATDYTNGSLTGTAYYNVNIASQTSTSSTAANSRTAQTLSGFVAGLIDQIDHTGAYTGTRAFGNDGQGPNLSITTSPSTNRASATVTQQNWATGVSATFNLGSTTGTDAASTAFIDDKNYAMKTSATGTPTSFTGSANAVGSSSTVLVSGATNPTALDGLYRAANTGVAQNSTDYISQCTCSFLTWGWWNGGVSYTSGYNPGGTDSLHLAPYVAGTLTDTTTLTNMHNSSTTATYKGDMIGNVRTGTGSYVAVGGYSNTFNFGTNTGTVAITNFDGVSYTGTNSVSGNTITGSFSNSSAGRSGTLNGAFFGAGAAGQAGTFGITNNTGAAYNAAGTFKAQK